MFILSISNRYLIILTCMKGKIFVLFLKNKIPDKSQIMEINIKFRMETMMKKRIKMIGFQEYPKEIIE